MSKPKISGIVFSSEARLDLRDIWRFTKRRWSSAQADTYLRGIDEVVRRLGDFPMIARERIEFDPPVRIAHHKSHLIVYRIDGSILRIDRIMHASSNWQVILMDSEGHP